MKILKSAKELQNKTIAMREGFTIGFVPTMGGLHQGHLSLIKRAKSENDICLVSLFLNPTQFDNQNDLINYPASLQEDLNLLKDHNVDLVFTPDFNDLYPDNFRYKMTENELSQVLCGKSRPGHFDGVLTVVLKLLMLASANRAYFGEKDYQQLLLIKGMVESFFIPTEIVSCPIVRSDKGVALSSRNNRLSEQGLQKAQRFAEILNSQESLTDVRKLFENESFNLDYLEEKDHRRFAAVKIDNVRLIDNVPI